VLTEVSSVTIHPTEHPAHHGEHRPALQGEHVAKAQVSVSHPVLTDMNERIRTSAAAVQSTKDAYQAALDLRDELVETAINEGMSQRKVAAAAGIAVSRITGILLHRGRRDLSDEN
jgi:hypothetical protein